jgi:hypothetical protein
VSAGLEVDLDTSVLNELDFEFAVPCESIGHNATVITDKDHHGRWQKLITHSGGDAAWQQTGTCPMCGKTTTQLVCDSRRLSVIALLEEDGNTLCMTSCKVLSRTRDWSYRFTPLPGAEK